ncbi:MAG TPA: hypothetical protein VKQ29_07670 [Aliidongia sp.]|nr:hypothetical protein [Aliidongia sp.]
MTRARLTGEFLDIKRDLGLTWTGIAETLRSLILPSSPGLTR